MQMPISFSANTSTSSIFGTLVFTDESNIIQLSSRIGEQNTITLNKQEISHAGNFIASVIRRIDKSEEFISVTLLDTNETTEILRDEPKLKTTRLYKKTPKDGSPEIITSEGLIKISDINNNEHFLDITDMGFEPIDVPLDFKYTKNPLLNALYKKALLPYDYDKRMNTVIPKTIAKLKKSANGERWGFWAIGKTTQPERWHGKNHKAVLVTSEIVEAIEAELKLG
jgi:hypothetical protein